MRNGSFQGTCILSHTLTLLQIRSEVDDINLGLEHFYGDFNVVHAQLISSGVGFDLPCLLVDLI